MIYIGLDPGGRKEGSHAGTGLAVISTYDGKLRVEEARRVHWDEWVLGHCMDDYTTRYDPVKVVCEDFIPRWNQNFELDSVFLIGALRATLEPELIEMVTPSAHKALVKREWAKSLVQEAGFSVDQGHPVDAVSLCLYYGIKARDKVVLEALKQWRNK